MSTPVVLEMRGIVKQFPGVLANDHVDFDLRRGEVHALLGENGAGKSTLMNILYGLYRPDEGEIRVNGETATFHSAKDAIASGLGMVHQHFMLIPVMTVAENIVLATEPREAGVLLDYDEARRRVRDLADQFGFAIDPDANVQDITVGQEQRVEILKALYRRADILILDEPTAVLTPQEATELFGILRSLRGDGMSIIFISHKLNEVLEIADRITVLRRGRRIDTVPREGATEAGLARMMVGREVLLRVEKPPSTPGDVVLALSDVRVQDDRGLEKVRGVSFEVRAGEIVGIAGVDGNGQTELVEAITGLRRLHAGRITMAGTVAKDVRQPRFAWRRGLRSLVRGATVADGVALGGATFSPATPGSARKMLEAGIGHIPEDRQRYGLVLDFTLAENSALHDFRYRPDSRFGWLFPRALADRARRLIREFDVRGGDPQTRARNLSGGNQQKLVVAREVDRDPKVLIAAQPTRGLDVGAIEYLHRRLVEERDSGRAVLLVSLELDEVLSLSDRILVMYEGEIVAEHEYGVTEEEIGVEMLGGRREAAA
jgi:simple sugar transport system ATP-binding protein